MLSILKIDLDVNRKAQLHLTADTEADVEMKGLYEAVPTEEGTLYIACDVRTGVVDYKYHDPKNQHGYGGHVYKLPMRDGTVREIKGPWSSNEMSVHSLTSYRVMEASVHVKGLGYRLCRHFTVATLQALGVELVADDYWAASGELLYVPVIPLEPSHKAPQIEAFLDNPAAVKQAMGLEPWQAGGPVVGRTTAIKTRTCAWCGGVAESFDDDLSRKEFTISGMCQSCQNLTFGEDE